MEKKVKVHDMVVDKNYITATGKAATLTKKELLTGGGAFGADPSYKLEFSDGTEKDNQWDDNYNEYAPIKRSAGKRNTRRQRISRRIRRRKSNRRR